MENLVTNLEMEQNILTVERRQLKILLFSNNMKISGLGNLASPYVTFVNIYYVFVIFLSIYSESSYILNFYW